MPKKLLALAALVALVGGLRVAPADPSDGFQPFIGSMHEHSGYSDGWPGSTPATYFASGKAFGLDFLAGSEHSDTSMVPIVASSYCLDAPDPACVGGDPNPVNSILKWRAMGDYATAATTPDFTAIRGFEWTSDRFGHINVYFSTNDENAKLDGGYALTMETFYQWFRTPALLGGGDDGLATFNHPGGKKLMDNDAAFNWNDFAYVPDADDRMVGIEVYNDTGEYGTTRGPAEGYYVHALDKGWHLGPIGAEDLGHRKTDDWGGPGWAKTVILATDRSAASLKDAMHARRFYAVRWQDLRLEYTLDGALMGSRLALTAGTDVPVHGTINDPTVTLELVTNGGAVVAGGTGTLDTTITVAPGQTYYFLRARRDGAYVAYSAPVWVS